jgi:hypothetical protein
MEIPFLRKLIKQIPGSKRLGVYVFLPAFFLLGAGLEYIMIKWRLGETNFYETYKKKQAKRVLEDIIVKDVKA